MQGGKETLALKCILLGHPAVGKTCLANRMATGKFLDCPLTTYTSDFTTVHVRLASGALVDIDLWDTAGQERYRSLTLSFFRDARIVLVVYDAEKKMKLVDWLKEVHGHLTEGEALLFLVGSKLDLGDDVKLSEEEVQTLSSFGGPGRGIDGHFVLSSKTGENVQETFEEIAEIAWNAVRENRLDFSRKKGNVALDKNKTESVRAKGCCA